MIMPSGTRAHPPLGAATISVPLIHPSSAPRAPPVCPERPGTALRYCAKGSLAIPNAAQYGSTMLSGLKIAIVSASSARQEPP